jgi:septal ring factor EnvC (AmiA/AmiB activator)
MAIKMTKLFMSNPGVAREFVQAFHDAAKSTPVNIAANMLFAAIKEYVSLFARVDELQNAVQQTLGSGETAVIQALQRRESEVRAMIAEVHADTKALEDQLKERQAAVAHAIDPSMRDLLNLPPAIEKLRLLIKNYDAARDECFRTRRSQGLSESEIETIGLKPTPTDLTEWESKIEVHTDRLTRIRRFMASAPLYHLELLEADPAVSAN